MIGARPPPLKFSRVNPTVDLRIKFVVLSLLCKVRSNKEASLYFSRVKNIVPLLDTAAKALGDQRRVLRSLRHRLRDVVLVGDLD